MKLTLLKLACIFILITAFNLATNAQSFRDSDSEGTFKIGIGLEPGKPVGDYQDLFKFNLGGSIRMQYDLNENLAFTLSGGYSKFVSKNNTIAGTLTGTGVTLTTTVSAETFSIIPIKFGLKAYPVPNLYISAETGPAFEKDSDAQATLLLLSPGLGYSFDNGLDVGVRYEHFSGSGIYFNTVGLRLGYNFSF